MNKHTRVAFMVAPILAIIGFILADYYDEYHAGKEIIFQLIPEGHCDIINQKCILKSGEFKINIADKKGITEVNSTFPLDSATLFLVNKENKATPYLLSMQDSPYYWQSKTELRSFIAAKSASYKLRVIVKINGGQYISEFYSQTTK
ncbi:MAG: hypothetical protein HRT37_24300 [Alteromonadaceae bacterium]|nr:hypothetical protein [Alteromonadaceae bacterium]